MPIQSGEVQIGSWTSFYSGIVTHPDGTFLVQTDNSPSTVVVGTISPEGEITVGNTVVLGGSWTPRGSVHPGVLLQNSANNYRTISYTSSTATVVGSFTPGSNGNCMWPSMSGSGKVTGTRPGPSEDFGAPYSIIQAVVDTSGAITTQPTVIGTGQMAAFPVSGRGVINRTHRVLTMSVPMPGDPDAPPNTYAPVLLNQDTPTWNFTDVLASMPTVPGESATFGSGRSLGIPNEGESWIAAPDDRILLIDTYPSGDYAHELSLSGSTLTSLNSWKVPYGYRIAHLAYSSTGVPWACLWGDSDGVPDLGDGEQEIALICDPFNDGGTHHTVYLGTTDSWAQIGPVAGTDGMMYIREENGGGEVFLGFQSAPEPVPYLPDGTEPTIYLRGSVDSFTAGTLTSQGLAYVLTPTREQILSGWPEWHPRSADPIDPPFDGYLNWSGSAKIYDGNPVAIHPAKGPFMLGEKGYVANVVSEHRGTFEDFAIFEWETPTYLGADPVDAHVQADNAGATSGSGNITSAWTRHYRVLYPPKRARYAVPKILTGSLAASKALYLDAFQAEVLPLSTPAAPTDWMPPRRIMVRVKPTRLNYSINPSFVTSTAGIESEGSVTLTRDTANAWNGFASLKAEVAATSDPVWVTEDQDIEVLDGENFAVSYYAYVPDTLTGSYRPTVRFYTVLGGLVGTEYGSTIHERTQIGWDRQTLTTTVPNGAAIARVSLVSSSANPTATDTFYIDGVLVEKEAVIKPYFDGSSGDDYLWKQSGAVGETWSYYYEDRVKRHYILERTLRENVPLGVSIAEPEYAYGT